MPIKLKLYNPAGNVIHKDIENVYECLMQQLVYNKEQPTRGFTVPYDHTAEGFKWLLGSGITDIKDVEVYAGDILKCSRGRNDVVEFKNGCFWLTYRNCTLYHFMFELANSIEVIGSIHTNPELVG